MSQFVILDLEMCEVPKGPVRETFNRGSEIIQIGAVLVSEELEITDEFMTYVSPEFGVMTPFIEELTGITKEDLVGAPRVREALEMFLDWVPEDSILVTWSESDAAQIRGETAEKGIEIEGLDFYLDNYEDCQLTFGERMNAHKTYRLSEALIIANIDYDENIHDALVDARNTAQLFIKMELEDELVLTSYSSEGEDDPSNNPFAALLARFESEENPSRK